MRFCKRGSLNARFAPEAIELLRRHEMTRCATSRHAQRSKIHAYSITSSARTSSAVGR